MPTMSDPVRARRNDPCNWFLLPTLLLFTRSAKRALPDSLQFGALGGGLRFRFRAGLEKRLVTPKPLVEAAAKRDEVWRQWRGKREQRAHPDLLRFREDGKRIAARTDHSHTVRNRRQFTAYGASGVVGERTCRRRAIQDAGDKGWKSLPCKDILHGFLDPRLLL